MRIISSGIYVNRSIRFRCSLCHCDFEAEPHEYFLKTDDLGMLYCTKCPECGFEIEADRFSILGSRYNFEKEEN